MDRNGLTALVTILAVVPLYFKGPSQPTLEKWQYGAIHHEGDMEEGVMRVNAPEVFAEAKRDPANGEWKLSSHPAIDVETAELRDGVTTNIWGARGFMSAQGNAAREWMLQGGWQPFAVVPHANLGLGLPPTIHYRRRVQ